MSMEAERLLQNRNFRLHWASVAISHVGSFFTLVALPWLVLSLSNDNPMVVTTVVAAASLPNGLFILFGGGLADRFSAYRTLFVSRLLFLGTLGSLALLTYFGLLPLWLIYIYAVALGTFSAVGIPAGQSLLPAFLPARDLGPANGIVMGTMHLAQMIGPVAAGWLIWFGRELQGIPEGKPDPTSVAFAFAIEAATVAVAVALMTLMKIHMPPANRARLLPLIARGVKFCWDDHGIRVVLGYLILISFFVQGPLLSSLPLYTKLNLGLFERSYGMLYAMIGTGTILGAGIAMLARPTAGKLGAVVLCCDLTIGLALFALAQTREPLAAGALLLVMGVGLGITMVAGMTWFQVRTPGEFMGRVMSFVTFAVIGLIPVSATLTGALIAATSVSSVLSAAGLVIIVCTVVGLLLPSVRRMGSLPTAAEARAHTREAPLEAARIVEVNAALESNL